MDKEILYDSLKLFSKEKSLVGKIRLIAYILKSSKSSVYILTSSFLVTASSLFSNVFGYLFQLFAGNYLSKEDFSALTSLFAMSGIIALVVSFLANGIAKLVSEIKSENKARLATFFYSLLKINFIITIIVTTTLITFNSHGTRYLNLHNPTLFYIFAIAVGSGIMSSQFGPFLQGLQKFKHHAFYGFLTSLSKFLIIVFVIYFSLGLSSILWGLVITTIMIAVIGYYMTSREFGVEKITFKGKDIKILLSYSIGSLPALLGLNMLQNTDIILVKHFFSIDIASMYASLTIIGKIVFYVASPIGIVMLPICSEYFKNKHNVLKPFILSLCLTIIAAGSTSIIFALFPGFIIDVLFSNKYLNASLYLPLFAIFMLVYTLATLSGLFLISVSKFKQASVSLIGAFIQYLFITIFHNDIYTVINISIWSTVFVLILYLLFIIQSLTRNSNLN